jgi:hypothetical protein
MNDDKAAVLSRLARAVASSGSGDPLAVRLCRACVDIAHAAGGAITFGYASDDRMTVCTTGEVSARLEDLAYVLGEGPGWDAYRSGQVVSGDVQDERWPVFGASARREIGMVYLDALPMRPGGQLMGVLTLHRRSGRSGAGAFDVEMAQFVADAVGAALLREPGWGDDKGPVGPWAARSRVHQATGMVVAQLGIGVEDAMALLRAHAFAHAASLDDIAAQILSRRLNFSITDTTTRNEEP